MNQDKCFKKMDRKLKNRLSEKRSRDATKSHILQLEKNDVALTRYVQLLEQRLVFETATNALQANERSNQKQICSYG